MNYTEHLDRLRAGVRNTYNLANLSTWITKNTKIDSKPFTFAGHEYQKDIIDDPAKTLYCVKAAQTGLTEIFARFVLGAAVTQENFTTIWTFPSASDATKFSQSRLQAIIDDSAAVRHSLSKQVDSVELKKFGQNSYIYTRGTLSESGALSIPADLLCHDEYDRSDMDNISAYVSRLQYKPTKMRRIFSTPTVDKYGISKEAETSKRKRQVWRCSHCNHTWLPSLEHDIVIPGWDRPKREITKQNIKDVRWSEAKLLCPTCGKIPDTDVRHREWVVENPGDNYDAVTYYVGPFTAPTFLTPQYQVRAIADFGKWSEYLNQVQGLTAEDQDESLTRRDIENALIQSELTDSGVHVLGIDIGAACTIAVSRVDSAGRLLVVHREKVSYTRIEERRHELVRLYRVVSTVLDAQPYTDIARRMTDYDPNVRAAFYTVKKSTELFTLKEQEEDVDIAKVNVRSVVINREVSFDELMHRFKSRAVYVQKSTKDEEWISEMLDMKRVQVLDKTGELNYKWQKSSQGQDHAHHALLYCMIAGELLGATRSPVELGKTALVSKFKGHR